MPPDRAACARHPGGEDRRESPLAPLLRRALSLQVPLGSGLQEQFSLPCPQARARSRGRFPVRRRSRPLLFLQCLSRLFSVDGDFLILVLKLIELVIQPSLG